MKVERNTTLLLEEITSLRKKWVAAWEKQEDSYQQYNQERIKASEEAVIQAKEYLESIGIDAIKQSGLTTEIIKKRFLFSDILSEVFDTAKAMDKHPLLRFKKDYMGGCSFYHGNYIPEKVLGSFSYTRKWWNSWYNKVRSGNTTVVILAAGSDYFLEENTMTREDPALEGMFNKVSGLLLKGINTVVLEDSEISHLEWIERTLENAR